MTSITRDTRKLGSMRRVTTFTVEDYRGPGDVNFRSGPCWRPDNRYPGDWSVRRHETGGLELTFSGVQHNSKDVVKVIPPDQIDRFILSCLECRPD